MELGEVIARLTAIEQDLDSLTVSATDWGREDVDCAVEAWDRFDRLIATLQLMRRDLGLDIARRIGDQHTAVLPNGDHITVHRDLPKTEQWDGWQVLGDLGQPVIDANGEQIDAIPVDVARRVLPACTQGAVSSKWKVTELNRIDRDIAKQHRQVTWGDPIIARGPSRTARSKPPVPLEDEV